MLAYDEDAVLRGAGQTGFAEGMGGTDYSFTAAFQREVWGLETQDG